MKYNTQNAKIASITEKTLIVGIDIGSETHFARAFDWRNYEYTKKPFEFSNNKEGFQAFESWMEELSAKHGKTAVIPGMEPTGHYWFALGKFLQDNGMRPVHVNPHHVKKSKELDDNNPNKNDRKDRGDSRTLIYQSVSMRKSEIYRTCGFRHRKSLPEPKTGLPDGSPSTSRSIRTFTGISRQSVDGWCCRWLLFRKIFGSWVWRV